jgi:hypothetical protein
MWVVILLCAITSDSCTLYNNIGNLNSYSWRLYTSKKECSRDGQVAANKWSKIDKNRYIYYCQDTSFPSGSPFSSMKIPPIAEQKPPITSSSPAGNTAEPAPLAIPSSPVGNTPTPSMKPLPPAEPAPPPTPNLSAGNTPTPSVKPPPPARIVSQPLRVTFSPLTPALRKQYRIAPKMTGAVVVTDVAAGSLAAEKGVQPGDVIVSISDKKIEKPEDVRDRLEALVRGGKTTAFVLFKSPNGNSRFVVVGLPAPN